jgi:predicted nucleotidyltransferase
MRLLDPERKTTFKGMDQKRAQTPLDTRSARRVVAERVAHDVLSTLADMGVHAVLTGSVAEGRVRAHSDVDILILDNGGLEDVPVLLAAEKAAKGFPVDVVWAKYLRAHVLESMLAKVKPHAA